MPSLGVGLGTSNTVVKSGNHLTTRIADSVVCSIITLNSFGNNDIIYPGMLNLRVYQLFLYI